MTAHGEQPSDFFLAWGRFVVGNRWVLLALSILVTGLAGWLAQQQIRTDMGIDAFSEKDARTSQILDELRADFGRDDVWVLVIEGDVFSSHYVRKLRELEQAYARLSMDLPSLAAMNADMESAGRRVRESKEIEGSDDIFDDEFEDEDSDGDVGWGDESDGTLFEEITSLLNTKEVRGTRDGIRVSNLIGADLSEAALSNARRRALTDPSIVGHMVSATGRHALMVLRAPFLDQSDTTKLTAQIRAIAQDIGEADFLIHVAGVPTLNSDLTELSIDNMERLFSIALLLMICLLGLIFRHPLGIIGPIGVVLLATVNTFGLMAVLDMPVTMLSTILPSFIVCVGVGDSVHLLSVFRDARHRGMSSVDASILAVGTTGKPVFFTSMTTMIGLLSFRFASIEGIQEMGTAGGFGVAAACLHSLVFLPIILSFVRRGQMGKKPSEQRDLLDNFLARCNAASCELHDPGTGQESRLGRRRRRFTLVFGSVLILAFALSMLQLRVYHNPMSWLDAQHPLSVAFEVMDHHLGGNASIDLLVDGPSGSGLRDLGLMKGLERLENHMKSYRHPDYGLIVGPTMSVSAVVKATQRALNDGRPDAYRLPDDARGISDSLFLFENQGPVQLRRLATNDLQRGRVTYRLKWLEADAYGPLADHLEQGIESYIPSNSSVRPTGTAFTLLSTIGRLITDLGRSFGVACILITLLLIIQLRSLKMGLIAMVPNLVPIIFVMGFMGLVGIPIDLVNILIASIAIGIAVDDTIHLLHHFKVHHEQYGNVEAAIRNAFDHAGRAMVSTTIILGLGFLVFIFATIDNIMRFGLLIALTAVTAMFVDLVFTPALLRTFYRRQPKSNVDLSDAELAGD
ncbi:MAG: efflux RND transporter permease subunit [Myxococcota bacterium]|nr:efflux RND transporter permease subunit [Myxococcota bacterium]